MVAALFPFAIRSPIVGLRQYTGKSFNQSAPISALTIH
jgi:hypothetical protein